MEKILRILIKIAAVTLTAPATISVASTLYMDTGLFRWIVAIACLMLVEGALLLGWQLLDERGKSATTGQRGLYASLVIVAYVVLWLVALAHGEGLAGIAFRSTLGVLIVYSLAEAGILAGLRQEAAVLKDFSRDGKVKRHAKKLGITASIADLDAEHQIRAKHREYQIQEQYAHLEDYHNRAMQDIKQIAQPVDVKPKARKLGNRSWYPTERASHYLAAFGNGSGDDQ
jgi:hypothetical protein